MRLFTPVRWMVAGLFALFFFSPLFPAAAQTRPQESVTAEPLQEVPLNRPEDGLIYDDLVAAKSGPCVGMFQVGKTEICTHGPDAVPPGKNVFVPTAPVEELAPSAVVCEGDGVSGKRTQIMYVRSSDRPDRYSQYLASFRQWASDMDTIYNASAAETGGSRRIRFVTDSACNVVVLNVVISPSGDDSFNNTINEVSARGYNSANRKYVMFVDANVYCGIGGIQNDDRAIATNRNDTTTSYSRVDAGCWGGSTASHELMHNIGGVQLSAPHTSRGWHCVDEYDLMCYSDSPYYPPMQYLCNNQAHANRFDCNHDDYYHTNPPAGSYLATHWNSANSAFLIKPATTTTPPSTPTNLRVTSTTTNRIYLAWSDTSNETQYTIQKWRLVNGQWQWTIWANLAANTTTYSDGNLSCGSIYYYRITASNSAGTSAASAWVSGTTKACAKSDGTESPQIDNVPPQ